MKNIKAHMAKLKPTGSPEDFKRISQKELEKIIAGKIGVWAVRNKIEQLEIRDSSYAQKEVAQEVLDALREEREPKISVKERAQNVVKSQKRITIGGMREALGIMKGTPQDNTLRGRLSEAVKEGKFRRISRGVYETI